MKVKESTKNEQQEGREELIIEDDEDIIGDDTAKDLTTPKHPKLRQNVEKLFAV